MKVRDVMSKRLFTTTQEETLESAARIMAERDIGMLPVLAADGRVVGTITDRDIAVRAVARGLETRSTRVEAAMTPGCERCLEDDSVQDVAERMAVRKVRRLLVTDQDGRTPLGVVSLDDLATHGKSRKVAGVVLSQVAAR
jgi:CBS domain-containing protein